MGKQNNEDNKGAAAFVLVIVIMGIIFLLFAFATLLAPVVVLVLFLVNWIRYLVQDRKWRKVNFWLSTQEQKQYEQTVYVLARAEKEKGSVQDSVIAQGVSRNQDGQISVRSYAGKGLRERENTANATIGEYTPVYNELRLRPYVRWKKARSHYSKAFGFGFIIFVVVAMMGIVRLDNAIESRYLASIVQSEAVDSTKVVEQPKVAEQVDQAEQTDSQTEGSSEMCALKIYGMSIGIMAGFLAALVVIWFIGWLIGRIRFKLKNPEPPVVCMDNVRTHVEKYWAKMARESDERQQRKEERKHKREQKKIASKLAKEEKIRIAGQKSEEENQTAATEADSNVPAAGSETEAAVPVGNDARKRSKEENLFISWADNLRREGYNITGNWENWEDSGLWKNLAIVSSVNGVDVRIVIEYYVKSKKVYFGIAKLNDKEKVSQELLNSEKFQRIIAENGLTVKNNEWWYCLKFSTLDKVFQEYRYLIGSIN